MSENSLWMWHYGEYEHFHINKVGLRREERDYYRPAFWRLSPTYINVRFHKQFESDGGYLIVTLNGIGNVECDGRMYGAGQRIELGSGLHSILIWCANEKGLPAAFVESDVCPSGEGWLCDHSTPDIYPVGTDAAFNSAEKNPEFFPFAYENIRPVSSERAEGGMLYDFGRELFGLINIGGVQPTAVLGVYYGESREEALDKDYSYLYEICSGEESYRLTQRAFRFIYIENADEDTAVSADYEYLPLEKKGSFTCDNPLFNEVYDVCIHTFHLNCREGFLDGIKRDRWVWSGDAFQSARINAYMFADKKIEQRTAIGLAGKQPVEQFINTIIDYTLLWIIGLGEHYMNYADSVYLKQVFPIAKAQLSFCETRLNCDGFIQAQGDDWTFIDWASIDKTGAVCAEQMLLIAAYETMCELSKITGEDGKSYAGKSASLKKRVNEKYWNPSLGAFIDSYSSGKNNVTRHANIFAVMFGIASDEQRESILINVLKNPAVPKITTPYFTGYELDVLAKYGDYESIEKLLDSYWGGMLRLGATSVWEEFNPKKTGAEHYEMYGGRYHKSLCHAWGAGPVYLFGRYYLGVYPTSAGYETFCVEPHLGGLKHICGRVSVNGGFAEVEMTEHLLKVKATKPGGVLKAGGKTCPLPVGEELIIKL